MQFFLELDGFYFIIEHLLLYVDALIAIEPGNFEFSLQRLECFLLDGTFILLLRDCLFGKLLFE